MNVKISIIGQFLQMLLIFPTVIQKYETFYFCLQK